MTDSPTGRIHSGRSGRGYVTVTGHGSVRQEPNVLSLNIGIETRRGSVREAYGAAATALRSVLDRLRALGVGAENIAASQLSIQADTIWQQGRGSVVSAYIVSCTVGVRLEYEAGAEDVVAAVVDAGGNDVRLNGLQPQVSDPASGAVQARAKAWEDARAKAEEYAALAARSLGRAVRICESADDGAVLAMAHAASGQALALPQGQTSISAAVTVRWELT